MSANPDNPSRKSSLGESTLAATAARWVARRDAGLKVEEQTALRDWIRTDARHARALAAAEVQTSALNWPLYAGTADRVAAGLAERARRRRARRRRLAGTASAMLLLASAGMFFAGGRIPPTQNTIVVHSPRQQILPDGSRVELNEGAEIAVAFTATERRVELLRGTAHFEVHKDPQHPFLVSTGHVTARAVGTAFALGIETEQVALVVTEGRVAVDYRHGPEPATAPVAPNKPIPATERDPLAFVLAGESVAVRANPVSADTPIVTSLPASEWNERLAWRIPRLEFDSTPLREVVGTVNRYNRVQLVLVDDSLARLKLSGAVRADRIDGLLEALEAQFHIVVERRQGEILLRQTPRG